MLTGFRNFIMKGNVVDLAVAVVMGAAFSSVVTSIVQGLLTPLIGRLFNAKGVEEMQWEGFMYGSVISSIISFVLVAASIYFVVVLPMNHMIELRNRKLGINKDVKEEAAEDPQIALLTEIRDALKVSDR
ncbi:large conductance mechanosensitive channel protein MscL [Pseudarthrobacter sp. AL07]|uniref:large conductance mechanosensitive channel protein MscL n=1 Tax=unclassified Pseudarthrobacter TaxID=2647000 RepID=UPI00249A7B83|nr:MULTISPECIES: large conductance mechanosensitive channel protein MscL [unclassified Pseudarthrobacter]MDI3193785.1 large conductance mechanosensitive channel protein MscL [Pseudarthrobacter sp. AL20]MDI3207705.1 large conductance mechanosensitive channel protein MscL [Pseudarthrobacter sp. AL07]